MVAYSAKLQQARRPGWEEAYLDYARLKQSLLEGDLEAAVLEADNEEQRVGGSNSSRMSTIEAARRRFLGALETEIEKVSLFTLSRQGELADAVGAYRFPAYQISRIDHRVPPAPPPPPPEASPSDWLLSPITKRSGEPVAPLPSFLRTSSRSDGQPTTEAAAAAAASTTVPTRPMFRATESLSVNFGDDGAVVVSQQQVNNPAAPPPPPNNTSMMLDGYTRIAIELLHLLRYICVNGIGLRKLLKKYDKIMADVEHNSGTTARPDNNSIHQQRPADHIQQLANAASISAIHASLESALQQQQQQQQSVVGNGVDTTTTIPNNEAPILRLQCALDAIAILREYAVIVNQPFSEFLSHRAMIVTGGNEERKALLMLLQFEPETLAVISESELRAWKRASSQKNQNQKHHRRRTTMITFEDVDLGNLEGTLDEMEAWGGVNAASMAINLASTLLYTVSVPKLFPLGIKYAFRFSISLISLAAPCSFIHAAGELLHYRTNRKSLCDTAGYGRSLWFHSDRCILVCCHLCRLFVFLLVHSIVFSLGAPIFIRWRLAGQRPVCHGHFIQVHENGLGGTHPVRLCFGRSRQSTAHFVVCFFCAHDAGVGAVRGSGCHRHGRGSIFGRCY